MYSLATLLLNSVVIFRNFMPSNLAYLCSGKPSISQRPGLVMGSLSAIWRNVLIVATFWKFILCIFAVKRKYQDKDRPFWENAGEKLKHKTCYTSNYTWAACIFDNDSKFNFYSSKWRSHLTSNWPKLRIYLPTSLHKASSCWKHSSLRLSSADWSSLVLSLIRVCFFLAAWITRDIRLLPINNNERLTMIIPQLRVERWTLATAKLEIMAVKIDLNGGFAFPIEKYYFIRQNVHTYLSKCPPSYK